MRTKERVQRTTESELASIAFAHKLIEHRLAIPVQEFRFDPFRKWRFDYCWPEAKLALEVDGGVWTVRSRHTRGSGWHKDTEKLNRAAVLGWRMLRCTPQQLATDEMIGTIKAALKQREAA